VEAGSNTTTVTPRIEGGDEKKSLKSGTVKYGHEFGRAAYTKDRCVLSSERAPQKNDRNCQRLINISGARKEDFLIG
jgi:hypothetical protein